MTYTSAAQIQMYLSDMDFPCKKSEVIDHAMKRGASAEIIQALAHLSGERFYTSEDLDHAIVDMD